MTDKGRFILPSDQKITRWWWLRHAPVIEPHRRLYGDDDIPADTSDGDSFAALATRLPRNAIWVTSHLGRAIDTAKAVAAAGYAMPAPLVERGIAEQSYGAWQGRAHAEVAHEIARHGRHKYWFAPAAAKAPEGESFHDVMARVGATVARLTAAHAGRDIVAVSHGGAIRAALACAFGIDPDRALAISVENLSTTRLDHVAGEGLGGDWRLVFVNLRAK